MPHPTNPVRIATMPTHRIAHRLILVAALGLAGCASTTQPVIYGSPANAARPPRVAAADVTECRRLAQAAVGTNAARSATTPAAAGKKSAAEFVDRAVEQIVVNARNAMERARGAAAGVFAGGLVATALNWNEPDAVHRAFVDQCLKERGHKVLGWR